MWAPGSEAHSEPMINSYETTKALVHERQHQLTNDATLARMARRVRRARHNGAQADVTVDYTIVLPAPAETIRGHAVAA
jgi:hypothetical protein